MTTEKREKKVPYGNIASMYVHDGQDQAFQMTVVAKCRGDATKRQILEAVRIKRMSENRTMNSRGEWNTAKVPRIQIVSDVI